jgi:hypothetical protein
MNLKWQALPAILNLIEKKIFILSETQGVMMK